MSFLKKKLRLLRECFQYAYVADNSSLDLNSDMTLECQFMTYDNTLHNDLIMKWGSAASQRAYEFSYNGNLGQLQLEISDDGNTPGSAYGHVSWTPTNGVEYHVAVVYDKAAGSATFYVNGVQEGSTQTGLKTSVFNSSAALTIGTYDHESGGVQSECLDGWIRNARVWSDKRTTQEIADNIGAVLVGNESNLVACWEFNGTLQDKTSNNNHLTGVRNPIYFPYIPSGENSKSWLANDPKMGAYYRLESNGDDETANNNDLTVTGTPTFSPALFGNGVVIDSNSKNLNKLTGCVGLPAGLANFAIGIAIKRTGTLPLSPSGYMVLGVRTDGNNQSAISPGSSDNNVRLSMFSGGNGSYSTQVPLALNEWERLLFVRYDSGTKVKVYKNGKLIATDTVTARDHGTPAGIRLAESFSTWNCVFDDGIILSRKMLDDEAIAWTTKKRAIVIS
jgi:Concanavalin A-like lectin/glucanases superfamily